MHRIVVSDIFGVTPALVKLCNSFEGETVVVDPYGGEQLGFTEESAAYLFFMENVGLEKYIGILESMLCRIPSPISMIGFSVGGSAIWKLSENQPKSHIVSAVCFYSSQIRKYPEIEPLFPVHLVLPVSEPSFSVEQFADQVSSKTNVTVERSKYLHGFMNKLSKNYSKSGYKHYISWLGTGAS